jgi:glycosyltransferase involved in cell wall biosynthesis
VDSLAIVATHPIQYYVPLYRTLSKRDGLKVKVFYHHLPSAREQGVDFGEAFHWDIDLLSGYQSENGDIGIKKLMHGISAREFTAVLVHGWYDSFSKQVIAHALKHSVPVMVRGDSHLLTPRSLWKKFVKYPIYRFMLPKFAACLAVGSWNRDYYRFYSVPDSKILSSPHCVDNRRFQDQASELRPKRLQIRREMGIDEAETVFLYVGKMISIKRAGDIIAALEKCHDRSQIRCIFVGDGVLRKDLEHHAKLKKLKTTFTGFLNQTEIVKNYIVSDCVILPGEETWGLVVNEALSCGVPCLVSDRAGASEMIVSEINGNVYRCGDILHLSKEMIKFREHKYQFDSNDLLWKKILEKHSCDTAADGILRAVQFVNPNKDKS